MTSALITTVIVSAASALIVGSVAALKQAILGAFGLFQKNLDERLDGIDEALIRLSVENSGLKREQTRTNDRVTRLEEWRKFEENLRNQRGDA